MTRRELLASGAARSDTGNPWGRPNCHCADGQNLHSQFQISVLVDGKPKVFHIPAKLVPRVRQQVEMRRRFDAAAATICDINLRRFLKDKENQ